MIDLRKIKLGISPFGGSIYLYRHGKDPALALDQIPFEAEVFRCLVDYMFHDVDCDCIKVSKEVYFGDEVYEISVRRMEGIINNETD